MLKWARHDDVNTRMHLLILNNYLKVIASVLLATAFSAPQVQQPLRKEIAILKQSQDISPDGTYQWAYETENGISAQEEGAQKVIANEAGTAAQGRFSWTSPEGEQISVSYVADENGYQPQGSHIPTPPPIPLAILKALEYNAANPEPEAKQQVLKVF
ncbi:hypothetical protein NQ315_004928 [Exocentrus adspersus]|uniref:Uncharacterized protein n=1 Tax=Exocentrus adspersus TaxID=1586481 RepID=A0AAV8W3C1_9CUCU|nr:hypothetical protein NQ315_004928 [Exocentrus adspersus]